jgi:L-rhamnose mutarotase
LERAAFALKLRPGKEQEYRLEHTRVWPELIDEARRLGVRNQSVYLHGDDILVYMEAENIQECLATLATAPVNRIWDQFMEAYIEPESLRLSEVFHMD